MKASTKSLLRSVFDPDWYSCQRPEAVAEDVDLFTHFLEQGLPEGCDPGQWFDSTWYATTYPDVRMTRQIPLIHFLDHGIGEGRLPNGAWAAAGGWPEGLTPAVENLPAAVVAARRDRTGVWTLDPRREDPLPEGAAVWARALTLYLTHTRGDEYGTSA